MTYPGNQIPPENDLIAGCVEKDATMQRLLYERFSSKMYGVCIRYTENVNDAQDVLQEGFIKVYQNIGKFRGEGSFEGWIRRIFIHTSIEHYRKKIRLFNVSEVTENTLEDDKLNILDSLATKDILKIVAELTPGYKAIFNMHVIEGYSHKEIARILNITEGTSKSQLARAKGVLRKKIKAAFINTK